MNDEDKFRELTKGLKDISMPLKEIEKKKLIKTIFEDNHQTGIIAVIKIWK